MTERSAPEAMASLKALLEWFKQRFPYYKSACLHCHNNEDNRLLGQSVAPQTWLFSNIDTQHAANLGRKSEPRYSVSVGPGIAYPSAAERGFNATLTEVYVCSKCHKAYRFPRSVVISRSVLHTPDSAIACIVLVG